MDNIKGITISYREKMLRRKGFNEFADSVVDAGKEVLCITNPDDFVNSYADGYIPVVFGQHRHLKHIQGINALIMEGGYLGDRDLHRSIAWNGINGAGDHRAKHWMLDRPRDMKYPELVKSTYSIHRKPYEGRFLICGQVPTDTALKPFIARCKATKGKCLDQPSAHARANMEEHFAVDRSDAEIMKAVYVTMIYQLHDAWPGRTVHFRQHPKDRTNWDETQPRLPGITTGIMPSWRTSEQIPFLSELDKLQPIVVAVNSNSLTEATAWGYPTIAYDADSSMVQGMSFADLTLNKISQCKLIKGVEYTFARAKWYNLMTHMQFHIEEIKEGKMLKHIMS